MVGYLMVKKIEDIYNGLDTIPACDRHLQNGIYVKTIPMKFMLPSAAATTGDLGLYFLPR